MITIGNIKECIATKQKEQFKYYGTGHREHDYYYVREEDYDSIASEIFNLIFGLVAENAELTAKVKVYESVIEKSNFKTAVTKNGGEKC